MDLDHIISTCSQEMIPATGISHNKCHLLFLVSLWIPTYADEPLSPSHFGDYRKVDIEFLPSCVLPEIRFQKYGDPKHWLYRKIDLLAWQILRYPEEWVCRYSCFFFSSYRLLERWKKVTDKGLEEKTSKVADGLRVYSTSFRSGFHKVGPRPYNLPLDKCIFTLPDIQEYESEHKGDLFPGSWKDPINRMRCIDHVRQWKADEPGLLKRQIIPKLRAVGIENKEKSIWRWLLEAGLVEKEIGGAPTGPRKKEQPQATSYRRRKA